MNMLAAGIMTVVSLAFFGTLMAVGSFSLYQIIKHAPGQVALARTNKLASIGLGAFFTLLFTVAVLVSHTGEAQCAFFGMGSGFALCYALVLRLIAVQFQPAERAVDQKTVTETV